MSDKKILEISLWILDIAFIVMPILWVIILNNKTTISYTDISELAVSGVGFILALDYRKELKKRIEKLEEK